METSQRDCSLWFSFCGENKNDEVHSELMLVVVVVEVVTNRAQSLDPLQQRLKHAQHNTKTRITATVRLVNATAYFRLWERVCRACMQHSAFNTLNWRVSVFWLPPLDSVVMAKRQLRHDTDGRGGPHCTDDSRLVAHFSLSLLVPWRMCRESQCPCTSSSSRVHDNKSSLPPLEVFLFLFVFPINVRPPVRLRLPCVYCPLESINLRSSNSTSRGLSLSP